MANETRNSEAFEAFERLIENLDIQLSQSADGVYTVCTTQEPLFCYDSDSKEELSHLVVDTLASYAKYFLQIDVSNGETTSQPLEKELLPVEHFTPLERLKPVFDLAA